MPHLDFSHVTDWVFDLDNTLYPPQARLFDQIEPRIVDFIMRRLGVDRARADHLRRSYWRRYGTTLAGLMHEHRLEPGPYLAEVHEISMHTLAPDPALAARLRALPGRRIVFTNATAPYAERVLAARGLDDLFDGIYGVEEACFIAKPARAAFDAVFGQSGTRPRLAAMFEDDHRNLMAPHDMGMRTVLVGPDRHAADHVHHRTNDLAGFLGRLG